jgi:hypothetical protein
VLPNPLHTPTADVYLTTPTHTPAVSF